MTHLLCELRTLALTGGSSCVLAQKNKTACATFTKVGVRPARGVDDLRESGGEHPAWGAFVPAEFRARGDSGLVSARARDSPLTRSYLLDRVSVFSTSCPVLHRKASFFFIFRYPRFLFFLRCPSLHLLRLAVVFSLSFSVVFR